MIDVQNNNIIINVFRKSTLISQVSLFFPFPLTDFQNVNKMNENLVSYYSLQKVKLMCKGKELSLSCTHSVKVKTNCCNNAIITGTQLFRRCIALSTLCKSPSSG